MSNDFDDELNKATLVNEELEVETEDNEFEAETEEDEGNFFGEEPAPTTNTDSKYIKIEIDSVEKLISNLVFSAKEFENSIAKVEKNGDLTEILKILSNLKSIDLTQIEIQLKKSIKNIDTSMIKKMIDNKFSNIITASKNLEMYSQEFKDEEIIELFENISELKNFTHKFKFKSIIWSSIISVVTTSIISIYSLNQYYDLVYENQIKSFVADFRKNGDDIKRLIEKNMGSIAKDNKVVQIIFPKNKVNIFESSDSKIIEFQNEEPR